MSELIENGYKYLTEADLQAVAVYLHAQTYSQQGPGKTGQVKQASQRLGHRAHTANGCMRRT